MKHEQNFWIQKGFLIVTMLAVSACQSDSPTDATDLKGNQNDYWQRVTTPPGVIVSAVEINSRGHIVAGTNDGIFLSENNGATWTRVSQSKHVTQFITHPHHLIFASTSGDAILRSEDDGRSWTQTSNGIETPFLHSLAISPSNAIFAGSQSIGVFRSTDDGETWTKTGLTNYTVVGLAANNKGSTFAATGAIEGKIADGYVRLFRSLDSGVTWARSDSGLAATFVWALALNSKDRIFAATSDGVFHAAVDGQLWRSTGLHSLLVICLAINSHGHIFAGTQDRGIFRSADDGNTWLQLNSGFTNLKILSLKINSQGHVFAATEDGLFRSVVPAAKTTLE